MQSTSENMFLELFCQIISEPCFNTLRTKEQLGERRMAAGVLDLEEQPLSSEKILCYFRRALQKDLWNLFMGDLLLKDKQLIAYRHKHSS